MQNHISYRVWRFGRTQTALVAVLFAFSIFLFVPAHPSLAASTITVNSTIDEKRSNDGLCTLREAIIAANSDKSSGGRSGECPAGSGADTIILPAGTYTLSRTDSGNEDSASTGDLDISGNLTLTGAGAATTIISGNGITDRIVHVISGNVTISGVTIRQGNLPSGNGGGVQNSGTLTLSNSVITANNAPGSGGGLANSGTLTLTASTISANTAAGGGGFSNSGTATLTNVTLSGNGAPSSNSGTLTLNNVTAADGLTNSSGSLTLHNTLVSGPCTGTLTSQGYNLFTAASCTIAGDSTGNIIGLPALLGPLQNNGGPTPTHALTTGSPAIEAGSNTNCPTTDQRGVTRPRGLVCDIGAFELENPPQGGPLRIVNTANDINDGVCDFSHCSLREAINSANTAPGFQTITFAIPGGNTIQLLSALPTLTSSLTIDGTTQTQGKVILTPAPAAPSMDGLTINASNTTVKGLEITGFGGNGITILGGTGNTIRGNNIHNNGGLSLDLGGDGRTPNDPGDIDSAANTGQNFPVLQSAVPGGNLLIAGRLNSTANTVFTLEFFSSTGCGTATQTSLGTAAVNTNSAGNIYFQASLANVPAGQYIVATATSPDGSTSEYSDCVIVGADNTSWPKATRLTVAGNLTPTAVNQIIDTPGQSRWYKFSVQPNTKLIITLTNLPANYDLTVYKDISAAFTALNSPQDLNRLGAEFAPDAFSPDAFSPDAFSPDAFSPDAFSPDAFSPDAFSPDAFSPDAFSPDAFSPDAFSPDAFSPDAFSPDAFSPDAFSPDAFSPDAFSPDAFSPDAFSSAQSRSLIGVSAFRGTASEGIILNSWNNTGDIYVRVRGSNGAADPLNPFHLEVAALSGQCGSVQPITTATSHTSSAGNYTTLILTDYGRLTGTASEIATLQARLATFAARPDVKGVIINVGSDARVSAANNQADNRVNCPYAKNLVAAAIKDIVNDYADLNPNLKYILLIGGDNTIPFFRYPDKALLANESNYVPPVRDATPSQASLRLSYVLGQDEYGSSIEVASQVSMLPLPDLAVGRLVETAAEATTMLDAYLLTANGVVVPNTSPLVTGYDFLEDSAQAIKSQLEAGTGLTAAALIANSNLSPEDTSHTGSDRIWTANDLRALLFGSRHDIAFLAGHFSANSALAADYTTRITTEELLAATVDMRNTVTFSAGCHAGYNLVDADGIPLITRKLDWAQAYAQKGATLIAGTGYQYGDTDFIEYSERLYLEFSRQLRTGSGPVPIGQALVAAKQNYLADTAQLRGIHEKALIEASIFGFPMLSINMQGSRLTASGGGSIVSSTTAVTSNPGQALGLRYADINFTPSLNDHTVALEEVGTGNPVSAFYLSGGAGVLSNPAEPILPLEMASVGVPNLPLRGIGFRSGNYTDLANVLLLTGAPTTEIRGVHAPFLSDVFYPVRPWKANYFGALTDLGDTRLIVTPAQYKSTDTGSERGTLRKYTAMGFRLFYSNNISSFANGSVPALAAAPDIVRVSAVPTGSNVNFAIDVIGNPAAGIQSVWVSYTATSGPWAGKWQSLDLSQTAVSSRWIGTLPLGSTLPQDVRFIVQAVNGVGLVELDTNLGDYYIPGVTAVNQLPTALSLSTSAASGPYGSQINVSATLTQSGSGLAGQLVAFRLGPQTRIAFTNGSGTATATLSLLGLPGSYDVKASFAGTAAYAPASATAPFTINKQNTVLTLEQPASGFAEDNVILIANLTDATGRTLPEKTVFFVINGQLSIPVITDYAGRAKLGQLPSVPHGSYTVHAYFATTVPLHTAESVTLSDLRYNGSSTSGTLTLFNHAPSATDDAYSTAEDAVLTVNAAEGVLVNDTDPDSDPLSAILLSPPEFGTLSLAANGSFVYTPMANYNGSDSFTYSASDGVDSSPATVILTITPTNDAPSAANDSYSVNQDSVLSVPAPGVLGNDGDIDLDPLTAVLVLTPNHGSVALAADGSFTYTPTAGYVGSDAFTYRASDGAATSNEATVSIEVHLVNNAPNCTGALPSIDSIWPANMGFYPVTILGLTDADGDSITVTITSIFQDERVGRGKNNSPDGRGIGTSTAEVRAERDGTGNGRVYHISFTAADDVGGLCSGTIRVPIVPHDQSGNIDNIDGGPLYDSTQPS